MNYRYADIESALIKILRVADGDLGSFRAKIRRLRALGIPDLPKVGRGAQVDYDLGHALDLALAFTFDRFGIPPLSLKTYVERARSYLKNNRKVDPNLKFMMVITQSEKEDIAFIQPEQLPKYLRDNHFPAVLCVNVTAIENELKQAL